MKQFMIYLFFNHLNNFKYKYFNNTSCRASIFCSAVSLSPPSSVRDCG